ncbi:serine/threonine-protein kinase [Nonomuraea sp. NPDC051941]|uniref:serine/threonine-protein kinase n=1 Tax=Nonomuraea sp. NPDC051941 TaxID=3364373 RepID=UPI0037CC751D
MRQGRTVGGRYRQETCLVSSRATEVWVARDLLLNRDVVLKRMLVDNAGFSRLQAEARALAAFNHPHVVTLYDAVQDEDEAASWMVMEHAPGGSLDEHPPMPPQQAARLGAQIAGALAALHGKGIVHLDVKPGNIILTDDGVTKLADFGAAYRVGGRETITPNGAISYTVDYASPEVVLGRPEPASDVFSLGATLYALVAGRPPRPGADEEESDTYVTAWEAARGAVDMTADVGPLESLLADMLQREPVERPSAAEVQRRLEKIAGSAPPRPRRWPFIVGGAALVVVVAAYAVYHTVSRPPGERNPDALTAGSASSARPSAGPAGHPAGAVAPSVSSSASLIGDPRTADPCALTDPTALSRFGRTELDVDYGNFDRCDVIVLPPAKGVVDVKVLLDRDPPPERARPVRTVGPIEIVHDPAESTVCSRTLLLPGVHDTVVKIFADMVEDGEADLCAIADAATTTAAQVLAGGPIKRRSPPPPAGSLAQKDACALLRGDAHIDSANLDPGFGGWQCSWDSTTDDTSVYLQFDRELLRNTEDDGTPTRVNGYRAFVTPKGEGGGTCLLQVVYRSYTDQRGETAVEKVRIVVDGSLPTDRLCRMATDLARSAAAQLRGS